MLVITSAPDDRASTATLRIAVDEMRRQGVGVDVWFLRSWAPQEPWPGSWVVDELRTLRGTEQLTRLGLGRIAGAIRGAALRRRLRAAGPDAIVLDDGVGERVVEHLDSDVVRAIRWNPVPPTELFPEPKATDADLHIVTTGCEPVDPPSELAMGRLMNTPSARRARDGGWRAGVLGRMGLPPDGAQVLGWADDAWVDGQDLFIRALWTLRARHGRSPTAVWLDLADDPAAGRRFDEEVARCGLGDRVVRRTRPPDDAQLCGDVALLTSRAPRVAEELSRVVVAGSRLVSFAVNETSGAPGRYVSDLDLEALADALAVEVDRAGDRDSTVREVDGSEWYREIDVSSWVGRFLDAVELRSAP